MKTKQFQNPCTRLRIPVARRRAYWAVIAVASLACGSIANAQTATSTPASTNTPAAGTTVSGSSTNVTQLQETSVTAKLDVARQQLQPSLGASEYNFSPAQIRTVPGGENAQFNQILLRAPGVVQDSAVNGDLHVRGEHANLQYRINDVLLPEGITGFGLELDARFVESMKLITGALPAQYGFRTAGIVDIQTKSGAYENGGDAQIYGGSYDTYNPSVIYGGSTSNINYYVQGSYMHNTLGIENPTSSHDAIHDKTDQYKFFTYDSYLIDDTSRLSLMLGGSDSDFQVPNTPGTPAGTAPGGAQWVPGTFDSANLNENQNEQNYFGALTYQKVAGDLNLQLSAIGRESSVHFIPDPNGDLFFFGESSDVTRKLFSGGLQGDASYQLNESHTLRGGFQFIGETVAQDTSTVVFDMDPATQNPTGAPFPIADNHNLYGYFTGFYLQDEWKIWEPLTINYGARFDIFNSAFDNENQFSPRVNLVYKPWKNTTFHAGYARYFTPPPIEDVSGGTIDKFAGTSGAPSTFVDDPVKAERANYFDVGAIQKVGDTGLTLGVDSYYKHAQNQLDDGLFGQTLILSAFNYAEGQVEGVEFTGNYTRGGFSTYANVAVNDAIGTRIDSAQFLFDNNTLAYTDAGNYIHLDHHQTVAGSFGASYLWTESDKASLLAFADAIYGTGLRTDLSTATGTIPNGATLPDYYSVNCGLEQRFQVASKKFLKARLDVVNVTDRSYILRNGSGVGVGAPQYGQRRSFYGTIGFRF